MAYPEEGKLYTVTNVGSGYNLNQIGGFTSNGTNVTLWAPDTSDSEQWWKMEGDKLYPYKCQNGSKKVCLDRYITRDANYNNADLWEDNDDAQQTIILGVDATGDQFTIQLLNARADDGSALYLTGASNPNGGNNPSKVPGADGNVYWSTIPNYQAPSNYQLWRFTPVNQNPGTGGEEGPGGLQHLVFPFQNIYFTAGYKTQGYADSFPHLAPHHGIDCTGRGDYNIYASGKGTIVGIASSGANASASPMFWLGNVLAIQYDKTVANDGEYAGSRVIRYCHLQSIESNLKVGDTVYKGDKIAVMGQTGEGADVDHLHLEMDLNINTPLVTRSEQGDSVPDSTVDPMNLFWKGDNQTYLIDTDTSANGNRYVFDRDFPADEW